MPKCKKDTAPTFCYLRIEKSVRQGQQWQHIAVYNNDVPAVPWNPTNDDISSQTVSWLIAKARKYAVPEFNNCRFERIEIVTWFYAKSENVTIILLEAMKKSMKTVRFTKRILLPLFLSANYSVTVVTVEMLPSRPTLQTARKRLYSFICPACR